MDKFLERQIIPELTHKETKNLNESLVIENIELVIFKLPTKSNKETKQTNKKKKTQSNLKKIQVRIYNDPSKLFQKNKRGANTSQVILRGQNEPDTKTRHRYPQKTENQ